MTTSSTTNVVQPKAGILAFKQTLEALPHCRRASEVDIQALYALAHQSYQAGRNEEAFGRFQLLLLYRPTEPVYMLGAGLCLRRLGHYALAVEAYEAARLLQPARLDHAVGLAECRLLMHDDDAAQATLDEVLAECAADQCKADVASRARGLMELIRLRRTQSPAPRPSLPVMAASGEAHP